MDNRALGIQKNIQDASELKQDAQKLKEDYESKIKGISEEKTEILLEAKKKGDKIYDERVQEASVESEKVKERQRREIEQERAQMVDDLKKDTVNIALDAASKILSEELSQDKHKQLIAGFIDNLK
jgi:F-type H+-transporting ATPase subunit b